MAIKIEVKNLLKIFEKAPHEPLKKVATGIWREELLRENEIVVVDEFHSLYK